MSKANCFSLIFSLISVASLQLASQCPLKSGRFDLPTPSLNAVIAGDTLIQGKVDSTTEKPLPTGSKVQICISGSPEGAPVFVNDLGNFVIKTQKQIAGGVTITAQLIDTTGAAGQFASVESETNCKGDASTNSTGPKKPSLTITDSGKYTGNVPDATNGTVRICLNNVPVPGTPGKATVGKDGSFAGSGLKGDSNSQFTAQAASNDNPPVYGALSDAKMIPTSSTSSTSVVFIGGVEQSGYSSLGLSTNPFVNLTLQGPVANRVAGWGRIRLLSSPQPSTQGIVSTFTDPTGQLTTQDFTKVGTSMDFTVGGGFKLTDPDKSNTGWSIIADLGSTTPLTSQSVALTYKAPPPGTVECSTLTNRFTAANGYAPGLIAAPAGSSTCLAGGYTDIAFTNRDRSSFLRKWGFGVRSSAVFPCSTSDCQKDYGVLDVTIGQDEAITRGIMRHFVLKMDGVLPVPIKNSSILYLFGSAYIRTNRNTDLSPLILATETATVTIPSSTVIVLPLQQPDRDFYRLGVGLNLKQIFCKMYDCPTSTAK